MRPMSDRAKTKDTSRYARKGVGRDRMIKAKHRPEGKYSEGKGYAPRLRDVWPESN